MPRRLFQGRWGKPLAAVVVALVLAGGAFAYFTATGSGSATANVGTAQALTFAPGAPTTDLFPARSGDVDVLVSNPNSFSVHVNGLVLRAAEGTGGFDASPSGCDLSKLHYSMQTNGGSGWSIPANAASHHINLPSSISLDSDAPNSCQGAMFKVYLQAAP